MHTICNTISAILTVLALPLMLCACDDGHIDEPPYTATTDAYTIQIKGTFQHINTWSSPYTVAAACFDEESPYSLTLTPLADASQITLTNVPSTAKTVEIAVVNTLRKRIATICSYQISETKPYKDTIKIDVGNLDVGIYHTINQFVFQANSCSRCHSAQSPAASLDLTEANAYQNLVGTQATKDKSKKRVVAGDAANSFLYKVITEGDASVSYSHPALFTNETYSPFIDIIRIWIDNGAHI
ncbi:MAG: hypothetical protein IJT90_03530 [Bacteroidaceae bacterium]|nr:hypothetical protein [Bacteroidaceae bacterium]